MGFPLADTSELLATLASIRSPISNVGQVIDLGDISLAKQQSSEA